MSVKSFTGFSAKAEVTPIPTAFFTSIMPHLDDITELKIVLHIFRLLSRRRGYPRFVTLTELSQDAAILESMSDRSLDEFNASLQRALELAVQHGILLHLKLGKEGKSEDIYLVNTENEKKTVERIKRGELVLCGLPTLAKQTSERPRRIADIFTLYEQNIGIRTPIIAEQLQEAESRSPADWIEGAFKEAVSLNKRNWKYIARILERWAIEGKDDGALGRNIKKEKDPDRYIKGKYGHMVQR